MESTGKVAIHVGGTVAYTSSGLPFTSAGRLVTDNTNTVINYVNGLPFTATRLSVA